MTLCPGQSSSVATLTQDHYLLTILWPRILHSCISNSKERDYGFMSISMEGEPLGQLVFELLKTLYSRTCANFKALCTHCTGEGE